jgi:hypothetical protein
MSAATPPPYPPGAGTPEDPGADGTAGAPVAVPDELAVAPPGALLAGMLEDVDIEQVSGHDTVEVMLAEYRLMCRQQARFYRAVLETGLRKPFSIDTVERVVRPGEFAAEEARAALVWSRARAERAFGFAVDIFCRLPVLGEGMLAGRLDEPRARAFVDWTAGLTDAQAATVCDRLVPEAPGLMVGELIDRIKRACLAIDPDWAEKRYREAVRTRRVHGSRNPDGTANLGAYSQPVDRIAAAAERIDILARACKRAGDRRKIDLIRSDLFLGMTDGTFEGMADNEITAYVLAHPHVEPDDDADSSGGGEPGSSGGGNSGGEPGDTSGGPSGRPAFDGSGGGAPGDGTAGQPAGDQTASDDEAVSGDGGTTSDEATDNRRPTPDVAADVPVAGGSAEIGSGGAAVSATGRSATRWAIPEVRVELATVLGINEHPAEIPPWGYVPAARARQLIAGMQAAEWRYVLCDPAGRAIDGGLIQSRPATGSGEPVRRDPRRGGIVELGVPAGQLERIAATQTRSGQWEPVLVELASRAQERGRDPDTDSRDTSRRTPGAVLRRWIELRDRQCVHPCCRAPARTTDQDHRIGYAQGGPTIAANLSTPCRHDHRLKDEAGWAMHRPEPGITLWTSPLGHRYESRRPPVIPTVPEPYPDDQRRLEEPVGLYVWVSRPASCECDEPCDCEPQILPPVPTRAPREESMPDPEPTVIFDPNEAFPF